MLGLRQGCVRCSLNSTFYYIRSTQHPLKFVSMTLSESSSSHKSVPNNNQECLADVWGRDICVAIECATFFWHVLNSLGVQTIYFIPSCLASVTKVEASFYLELGSKSDRLQFIVSCTAGVTEIEASFLLQSGSPLLEVSEPLADPQPIYSQKRGCVLAWHDVMFGKHGWTLPRMQQLHNDAGIRARAFAVALLSGKVIDEFKGMVFIVASCLLSQRIIPQWKDTWRQRGATSMND